MRILHTSLSFMLAAVLLGLLPGCQSALGLPMSMAGMAHAMAHDRPATHGMLVVGEDTIFLSHLPMFHAPHDYQVILQAKFRRGDLDPMSVYGRDRRQSGRKVYTLVPEPFVLPDVVSAKRSFKADLFRGHFERGGLPIATGITVDIEQVVYFHQFEPTAGHPDHAQYLLFGKGSEAFLAHLISARPDFDQVLSLPAPASVNPVVLEQGQPVEFSALPGTMPLEPGRQYLGRVRGMSDAQALTVGDEVYQETGDLSM